MFQTLVGKGTDGGGGVQWGHRSADAHLLPVRLHGVNRLLRRRPGPGVAGTLNFPGGPTRGHSVERPDDRAVLWIVDDPYTDGLVMLKDSR